MKLRTSPRRGGGNGGSSSPGSSSSSSSSRASTAAANHLINNALTAAINDSGDEADELDRNNNNGSNYDNEDEEEDFTFFGGDGQDEESSDLLRQIRAEMSVEGIEKNARAKSTFNTHQNENTRFIVWLFSIKAYRVVIHPDLRNALKGIIDTVNYDEMLKKKYRGKKSEAERKKHYLFNQLRKKVAEFLGTLGSDETIKPTLLFSKFVENPKIYSDYLSKRRKSNGGIMKPNVYKSYRASLSFLFWRYDYQVPEQFSTKLKNIMDGVKRVANKARQCGEGNIEDGKRPLTFELFLQFNRWFLEMGTSQGMYALAYSLATFNLACRGDSTLMICLKHLIWKGDATGIPFSHSKEEQMGDDPRKRLPRYCFGNPFTQEADFISGILLYLATNPELLDDKDGPLFPESKDSHTKRFSDTLKLLLKDPEKREIIQKQYGFDPADIGVHSWRKAAHTKMNCGSTAGPTNSAACIRGGHSIGAVKDVYVVQEKASDQYCGRILAGLDELKSAFAVSYPDFIPIEVMESFKWVHEEGDDPLVRKGVSEEEYEEKKKEVDAAVGEVLDCIFTRERLDKFPTINRFLQVGLASFLIHSKTIADRIPSTSTLLHLPLFTMTKVYELKQHVRVAMPWDDHYKYFSQATGIPPHVVHYQHFAEIKQMIKNLPVQFEDALDARQFNGNISLAQMKELIMEAQREQQLQMAADIAAMKKVMEDGKLLPSSDSLSDEQDDVNYAQQFKLHLHPDGKMRRVPPGWTFPMNQLLQMYQYWHCGNQVQKICPMKFFDNQDVSFLGDSSRVRLNEVKRLMEIIDKTARQNGASPTTKMNMSTTNTCFLHGKAGLNIPTTTPTGRKRDIGTLKWSSAATYLPKEPKRRRANNS